MQLLSYIIMRETNDYIISVNKQDKMQDNEYSHLERKNVSFLASTNRTAVDWFIDTLQTI